MARLSSLPRFPWRRNLNPISTPTTFTTPQQRAGNLFPPPFPPQAPHDEQSDESSYRINGHIHQIPISPWHTPEGRGFRGCPPAPFSSPSSPQRAKRPELLPHQRLHPPDSHFALAHPGGAGVQGVSPCSLFLPKLPATSKAIRAPTASTATSTRFPFRPGTKVW